MKDDDILFGERRERQPRRDIPTWKILFGSAVAIAICVLIGLGIRISSNLHLCAVAKQAFADDPVLQREIGDWSSCSIIGLVRDQHDPSPDVTGVMYQVEGTKGSCVLLVAFFIKSDNIQAASIVTDSEAIELEIPESGP